MCNCKKDIEAKLLERFKSQTPEAADHETELAGYAIVFGESVDLVPFMPIHMEASYPVKKTGGWKTKKTSQNMMFSYCPFCGSSLKPKAEAEQPETAH